MSNPNQSSPVEVGRAEAGDVRSHTHRVLAYVSKADLEAFAAQLADVKKDCSLKWLVDGAKDMIVRSDDHLVAVSVQRVSADQELIKDLAAEYPSLSFDVLVVLDPVADSRASATFQGGKVASNWTVSTPETATRNARRNRRIGADVDR